MINLEWLIVFLGFYGEFEWLGWGFGTGIDKYRLVFQFRDIKYGGAEFFDHLIEETWIASWLECGIAASPSLASCTGDIYPVE